jgi:hypothetical protein
MYLPKLIVLATSCGFFQTEDVSFSEIPSETDEAGN